MRVLKEYQSRMDAEIAKGFLENSGIKAFVSGDDDGGVNPAMSATFGVRLLVSDEEYEKALSILKTVDQEK